MTINNLLDKVNNDLQKKEWLAWQNIVANLKLSGIDINEQNSLAQAIEAWGKEYHNLKKYLDKYPR